MEKLLEITDLSVEYRVGKSVAKALNGVTFSIGKGEALGLVGESGAGKTTTALSMLKLLPKRNAIIRGGRILFEDIDVTEASEAEMKRLRGKSMAMVFQNPLTSLNPVFKIGEQIGMALKSHANMSKSELRKAVGDMLETVGINRNRIDDYPNQFSGGMRQRVGIAAALACNPRLIIADEPTTALDVTIQAQILELIGGLIKNRNSSMLMITHNLGIVGELCDRVAVMYAGRIIEIGPVQRVFQAPAHFYTQGLFASIPKLTGERKPLEVIPGNVVNAQQIPGGCSFHPRCKACMERCKKEIPPMVAVEEGHSAACFRLMGGGLNV